MKKKFVWYSLVVTVIVLGLMLGLGMLVTAGNYRELSEKKIKEITAVYAANYSSDLVFATDPEVRVTVIDETGRVLADSQQISEENHLAREEIRAAAAGTPAVSVRKSETLGREMMYYAERTPTDDGFVYIRVAMPTERVHSYVLKSIAPMLFILLAVWMCSTVASVLFSGVLMKPLQQVKDGLTHIENRTYEKILPTTSDPDINVILSGIGDLGERLQTTIREAEEERRKLDYVLSNVTDGIVVFDPDLTVRIANTAVKEMFGVREPEGKPLAALAPSGEWLETMADCAAKHTDAIVPFTHEGRYYLSAVRYTDSDLLIAVLTDVTASKESEKMRLEFFDNASHELKTPLTAIKGFNELISLGTKEGAVQDYSAHIAKEVDRMIRLLSDMLDLSRLENSSAEEGTPVDVPMREVADEVKACLDPLCAEKQVTLTVEGEGTVNAEREHIYELIKNLAENGVRYNTTGGQVKVEITSDAGGVKLTVTDDGIGIDPSQQDRIFERFYRVDKSRSRATGGTGLGLAIVKHICERYRAELTLRSRLGGGSTFTVCFNA